MSRFSDFLKARRTRLSFSVTHLAEATGLTEDALYSYESGKRVVPRGSKSARLRQALCTDEDSKHQFDELLDEAMSDRPHSPLTLDIGSTSSAGWKIAPLVFEPFSGRGDRFADIFLRTMLEHAVIKFDIPVFAVPQTATQRFDMRERVRWVEEGRIDILVNLISLQRLRRLKYLSSPIRVSLNAVILQPDEENVDSCENRVRAAEKLLIQGERTPGCDYKVLAVEYEVGHVYVEQTRRMGRDRILLEDTLDARVLADRLLKLSPGLVMLVTDEITALSVVRALGGKGTLVLPPSTDQSVTHVVARRIPPVHYLGFGLRRRNNDPLVEYLTEALATYVSTELEPVAAMMETLYVDLVKHVTECLQFTTAYRGGVRRIPTSPGPDTAAMKRHEEDRKRVTNSLREQNARAYARRCLNLSRRALGDLPPELEPWGPVLRRTRERAQFRDARNRVQVRDVIVSSMKSVLGIDPLGNFEGIYKKYFDRATDPEHRGDFKYILERELDVSLPQIPESAMESASKGLELFVSAVQRAMEDTVDMTNVVSVKLVSDEDGLSQTFEELWGRYARVIHPKEMPPEWEFKAHVAAVGRGAVRFVAFNLGEPVGLIESKEIRIGKKKALEIQHLFVSEAAQGSGISRRLIRKIIDEAVPNREYIVLAPETPSDIEDAFKRSGFSMAAPGDKGKPKGLFYELFGIQEGPENRV